MEWSPESLQFLSQCFLHSLSISPEPRRQTESSLLEASDRPGFGLAVLRLVVEPSVDEQIRIAAALYFRNHLKARWASEEQTTISDEEKSLIRALIVSLMLSAAAKIQSQLSEALTVIGKHEVLYQYRSDALFMDLKYCLDNFAAPLTEMFRKTASLIDTDVVSGSATAMNLRPLLSP